MAQPKPQHDRPPSLTAFGIHVCAWASPAAATRTWPCYMAGCTLQRTRNYCEQRTASGAGTRCKVTISQHVSALLPRTAFCLTARQETEAKETAESAGRGVDGAAHAKRRIPTCLSILKTGVHWDDCQRQRETITMTFINLKWLSSMTTFIN